MKTKNAAPSQQNVNDDQWQAITHPQRPLLIVAGPGTGKTHTLTQRIVHTLRHIHTSQNVLAITFTNKAAEELQARVQAQGPLEKGRVLVGTFHQMCWRWLQTTLTQAGSPRLCPPEDLIQMVQGLWPKRSLGECRRTLDRVSRWKATYLGDKHELPDEVIQYNQSLKEKHFVDFDDILIDTYTLFRRNPQQREVLLGDMAHIYVDEYQDINPVQHALLKLLAQPPRTITAIGDPQQAIYGFRGARADYFNQFADDFDGAVILTLAQNYRCGQDIVAASSQLMRAAPTVDVPVLVAALHHQGRLTIHQAHTEKGEAVYVARVIEQLVGGTSLYAYDTGQLPSGAEAQYSFEDIAILYRLNRGR